MQEIYGDILSFGGSLLGSGGAVVNALGYHNEAFVIWAISNPMLLGWAIGYHKKWWDGGIPAVALICMYTIFIVFNCYALMELL